MSLRSNRSLRKRKVKEDFDPMSGMGNLADVMLVFACGLLLALIIHWEVDLGKSKTQTPENTYEVKSVENAGTKNVDEDSQLKQKGIVYEDPETGKYYMVEDE